MITLPFVLQASPNTRQSLEETLGAIAQTLEALKAILILEGLYAPDGTLGIENGSLAIHFSRDVKKVEIYDTSEDIPF